MLFFELMGIVLSAILTTAGLYMMVFPGRDHAPARIQQRFSKWV